MKTNKTALLRIFGVIMVLLIIVYVISLLNNRVQQTSTNKLKVVATTTQLADFVKNLAGDKVELTTIFTPNVDPHEYDPTPNDISKIESADFIIENGFDLDKRIQKNIDAAQGKLLIASYFIVGLKEGGTYDPHIWFSVENSKKIVEEIALGLTLLDPTNKDFYTANKTTYTNELNDLSTYIKTRVSELPEGKRKLVTNHDAFGYYVNEFGLNFIGSVIPNLSTESQPSAIETADLVNKIKTENVTAIFTETSINPKLAEQIASETNTKVIDNLYGDTLGEAGSPADTYIKMMKYDTDLIVDNLK